MKHKTATLEGALLDAAVAKALGLDFDLIPPGTGPMSIGPVDASPVREGGWLPVDGMCVVGLEPFAPSLLPEHGQPIIERVGISLSPLFSAMDKTRVPGWDASIYRSIDGCLEQGGPVASERGETPLIAAMRAYVASKYGDEVELP